MPVQLHSKQKGGTMKTKVSSRLAVLFGLCAFWSLAFVAHGSESYVLVKKWATGAEGGEFCRPTGVAVDPADGGGNVYVVDYVNQCVQKFTSQGAFLKQWGTYGSGEGEFLNPAGIAVDSSGNVYVADEVNHRIQKFTPEGVFLTKWGTEGSEDGQFEFPWGVAVDSSGNVYVADSGNHRIQKLRPSLPAAFAVDQLAYGPGGLTVVWVSEPGKSYQIWQCAALAGWEAFPAIVESQGDSTSWTDDASTELRQRFYKIELLPLP